MKRALFGGGFKCFWRVFFGDILRNTSYAQPSAREDLPAYARTLRGSILCKFYGSLKNDHLAIDFSCTKSSCFLLATGWPCRLTCKLCNAQASVPRAICLVANQTTQTRPKVPKRALFQKIQKKSLSPFSKKKWSLSSMLRSISF